MPRARASTARITPCRFPRTSASITPSACTRRPRRRTNCSRTATVICMQCRRRACAFSRCTDPGGGPTWRRCCSRRRFSRARRSACSTRAGCGAISRTSTTSSRRSCACWNSRPPAAALRTRSTTSAITTRSSSRRSLPRWSDSSADPRSGSTRRCSRATFPQPTQPSTGSLRSPGLRREPRSRMDLRGSSRGTAIITVSRRA